MATRKEQKCPDIPEDDCDSSNSKQLLHNVFATMVLGRKKKETLLQGQEMGEEVSPRRREMRENRNQTCQLQLTSDP